MKFWFICKIIGVHLTLLCLPFGHHHHGVTHCIPQVVSVAVTPSGVITTGAMVTPGEVLTLDHVRYTVTSFDSQHALNTFTVSPHLPAADNGQIEDFTAPFCT